MKRRWLTLVPLLLFTVLAVFFVRRLELIHEGDAPDVIPSVMIDRPAPDFTLPSLYQGKPPVTLAALKGHAAVVNIFASWCLPCRAEHPVLAELKQIGAVLVGINYKDKPDAARGWLARMGDPYDMIGSDADGRVAIDFGAYGVPETYLIDRAGKIRFKQTGPLTDEVIRERIAPMIRELER